MQLRHGMPWVKAGRGVACALTVLRKIDGKYLPTKRNGDAFSGLSIKRKAQQGMQALKNKLVQPIVRRHQNFIKTSLPSAD